MGEELKKTLGQILLEQKVISPEQLASALRIQKEEKGKYLGQILIEMGVSQGKINQSLDDYNKRKPMGQILLDLKVINPRQLDEALQKQKELQRKTLHQPLGRLLVEMGFTTYYSYLSALSKHFNMPIVSLKNFSVSSSLQESVGEKYARQHMVVVLENSPYKIKLAIAEPTHHLLDDIRRILPANKNVEFYLANLLEVENCLKKYL